jgi:hypothetical protein
MLLLAQCCKYERIYVTFYASNRVDMYLNNCGVGSAAPGIRKSHLIERKNWQFIATVAKSW